MKILILFQLIVIHNISGLHSVWRWECESSTSSCQKKLITNDTISSALSLSACRLICSEAGAIWPEPTGEVLIGNLTRINTNIITNVLLEPNVPSYNLVTEAVSIFKDRVLNLIPGHLMLYKQPMKTVTVNLEIKDSNVTKLTLTTDESYVLSIVDSSRGIEVLVKAETFFGVRHGLETLTQLIVFDDLRNQVLMPGNASITDKPAYPWRGILLDTSRNYVTKEVLKRNIDAMSASKLNTFHWHISDSHSFPFVSKSLPDLSKYGAYSPSKVYTSKDIEEILDYATVRGVRVIPEFDAPAHVGEGWQNSGFLACFKWQPWEDYCAEPPCGQFDPTKTELYDALEELYGDLIEEFQPEVFHMGGDEVNINCWNNTDNITQWMAIEKGWGRSSEDFIKLWAYFQNEALERLYNRTGRNIKVTLWTSDLTKHDNVTEILPNDKYFIQVWTDVNDEQIDNLLQKNYSLILSNYDALYLDCGFSGWVTSGNNWCSPYKGWQIVYENKPESIAGERKSQILGEEAVLWTEQADSASIDSRLWPRASALAEVLWSEPTTSWRKAEHRMLIHRERLVSLGVNADALEPEWCRQNEENCPIDADHSARTV